MYTEIIFTISQKMLTYKNELTFIIFIPLFFLIRSILIKYLKKNIKAAPNNGSFQSTVFSLVNWGTFYAIVFYAVAYYRNTVWLGKTWFMLGKTPVNTLTFIIPFIIISLAIKVSRIITSYLLVRVYNRYNIEEASRYTFNRIIQYLIIGLSVLIALPTIGFNLSILTVFAGVLGIGVGFGIQNIVSNFVSGLIILFEKPVKVGDRIKLGDLHCDVEHINIRATVVRTRNNEHIIIPNSQFIENQVVNWSYGDPRIRELIFIGVAYGSDVRLVEKILLSTAEEHPDILTEPQMPRVDFLNFGESSLDFRLLYWIPNAAMRIRVKSALNHRIYELFLEHNIEIPFPQRDLHIRSVDPCLVKKFQIEYEDEKRI
jgi:small-conductance mechanosensitive channel